MKKSYIIALMMSFIAINALCAQTVVLDTEVEVESEVEAEATPGQVAGSVSLAAGVGANFPNALAKIFLSGGMSRGTTVPAASAGRSTQGEFSRFPSFNNYIPIAENRNSRNRRADIFLAEAEVEVESEVEVEVENGAAVAVGGTAAGAAGVGASTYTIQGGGSDTYYYPANTVTSVLARTSTGVSLSQVNIDYPENTGPSQTIDGGSSSSVNRLAFNETKPESNSSDTKSDNGASTLRDIPFGVVYATETDVPVSQIETDTETEVEVEAEVEAEAETGAGGAAASAGVATMVTGDFGVVSSDVRVNTSASSSVVNDIEPQIFRIPEPARNFAENTGSGNENITTTRNSSRNNGSAIQLRSTGETALRDATSLADVPTAVNGKGFTSFETEAESEVEAEAEAENGAAVAGVATAGSTGANGQTSSAESASSTSVSTSTEADNGVSVLDNGQMFEQESRNPSLTDALPGAGAEAEAEAEANAEGTPSINTTSNALGLGDALAQGTLEISDVDTMTRTSDNSSNNSVSSDPKHYDFFEERIRSWDDVAVANDARVAFAQDLSLNNIESEVEAEAEAEVGFNSAAAAAGTNATQGKNGVLPFEAMAASSSSTSTGVFDQPVNNNSHDKTTTPATGLTYPDYGIDFSSYEYEAETETEVEAEVGFNSSAVAVSAAAGGYDGIQVKTAFDSHLHAAAGAAGAGKVVTVSITMPLEGEAGTVSATATASDDELRGVSVAVAVAGVPNTPGEDNEMEMEAEGIDFATATVSIDTDPANVANPVILNGFVNPQNSSETSSSNNETSVPQFGTLGEVEAEAESEAEAGYGVAAAAATAGATGRFAVSESFTKVTTDNYTGGYNFSFDALINESIAIIPMTTNDVVLYWNGYGYDQFIIEQFNETTGTYVQVGIVNRVNMDQWEAYSFSISGLPEEEEQTFQIRPTTNAADAVQLTITIPATLSNDDIIVENSIILPYPNPVSNVLHVRVKLSNSQEIKGSIYDLSGKLIDSFTRDYNTSNSVQTLDYTVSESISNGLYILVVSSEEMTQSYKISVMR
ncbi:T9SS type A sorting domain-containing protein [Winogradskyella maritima]|uniref:T9SS type A sorting domain-containing protein n=1 Tax=Winogradskyella maritima TaxID=1517766 RepID=A0ABV8AD64_9FLAO|nr:T9SS type A sorting domain-containing protein [Winogradskyella maritima]